jgi:hypothetical protein
MQCKVAHMSVDVSTGEYMKVIKEGSHLWQLVSGQEVFEAVRDKVEAFVFQDGHQQVAVHARALYVLLVGASLLLSFQQANWTGPSLPQATLEELDSLFSSFKGDLELKDHARLLLGCKCGLDDDITSMCVQPSELLASVALLLALTELAKLHGKALMHCIMLVSPLSTHSPYINIYIYMIIDRA